MNKKAYLVGGGIGSMAAAAFMIRDGKMNGSDITILEAASVPGGSLDGCGDPEQGYSMRGGRMLTFDNYECTWDLFKSIPSLTAKNKSVFEETIAFNESHKSNSKARLVDRWRAKIPVTSMGFSIKDRAELLQLSNADEGTLGNSTITDWLSPSFFETEFWYMWSTTFAFQPWHSAVEFKRYLHRFMLEFTRIETLGGVKRTIFNQYDSLVRPLRSWLETEGVHFVMDCTVTDFEHRIVDDMFVVSAIHCRRQGLDEMIEVGQNDLVFFQNGSMTDASSLGSMTTAPSSLSKRDSGGWALWEKLARGRPEFGNPAVFNSCIAQSSWESFTVTSKSLAFFNSMQEFTGNEAGTGGLVTFKDSNWLMSVVLPHQPHFPGQPEGVGVFWGYALFPDRVGNFVAKPMAECNGEEILRELCGHLRFDRDSLAQAICIPCRMPYITSMFMPRARGDRPLPVPQKSRNLAFISQFVEIEDDVVFTVEYSVRAAQTAVYQLLCVDRQVPAIKQHDKSLAVQFETLIKALR
ncbi:67 kDa myosin-cross-reactive antigen like family protein [Collimonas arenae]|uniref:67 kDa myosin-cross-reactive antigen like family protein n=1 Tax=Collimonas arenae TaxID=279058 RepID=A0A127QJS3_9BURK|nr:67 kDa myosin-cross-reactive antigen like family protein [Collimonas arenae]AMP10035.1 67 kDa myosin-cross-reactive antigen like family protein [Collimonas arenae]